jgi:hypothetical protein
MILFVHPGERPQCKQPDGERDRVRQEEAERQPADQGWGQAPHAARTM